MATDLGTKPAPPKHEFYVETELAKVRNRIRALDIGHSLLLIGVIVFAYLLAMGLFDLLVKGADTPLINGFRLTAFGLFLAALGFVGVQLGLRLYRRINPYYAAKQLEDTLPDAKNSVINWLDLKEERLPAAIRQAVSLKAARDLKETDSDKAVNPRSNWLLAGIFIALLLGLMILFAMGPNQFG